MDIEFDIKERLKDVNLEKWKRNFYKVIIGEFNRVNDGKCCTEEQQVMIIKKLIKNTKEIIKYDPNNTSAQNEYAILMNYIPKQKQADEKVMRKTIDIILSNNKFKNKMQAMKPCIKFIENFGFSVDKGKLSKLLKESK